MDTVDDVPDQRKKPASNKRIIKHTIILEDEDDDEDDNQEQEPKPKRAKRDDSRVPSQPDLLEVCHIDIFAVAVMQLIK